MNTRPPEPRAYALARAALGMILIAVGSLFCILSIAPTGLTIKISGLAIRGVTPGAIFVLLGVAMFCWPSLRRQRPS